VTIEIQDNMDICQDTSSNVATISGRIATEEEETVGDVTVQLSSFAPEYPYQNTTATDGNYYFFYNPLGYDFEVSASRDIDYREGVNTLDLVKIQRHILGIEQLDSPFKLIAADATDDEAIKASELLAIRKLILGINNTFPNQSWRFVPKSYVFPDELDPHPFEETLEIDDLAANSVDNDLVAVKIGDVDGSISTQLNEQKYLSESRGLKTHLLQLRQEYREGKTYINVVATEHGKLYGFQCALRLADYEVVGAMAGIIPISSEHVHIEDDVLRLSWSTDQGVAVFEGTTLMTIEVEQRGEVPSISLLTDDYVRPHYYLDVLEVQGLQVEYLQHSVVESSDVPFVMQQNDPNPWIEQTFIDFYMPTDGDLSLRVYTVGGKTVYSRNGFFKKGAQRIAISGKDVNMSGIYFYEMTGESFKEVKKMIKVD